MVITFVVIKRNTMQENGRHFINLQNLNDHEPSALRYGMSPLSFVEAEESSNAQTVQQVLARMQEIDVLSPSVQVNGVSLIHEMNGNAFVQMGSLQRRYVHARFLVPDRSGNYKNGQVDDLPNLTERDRLTVISGPCLFSGSSVVAIDSDGGAHYINYPPAIDAIGSPIVKIRTDPGIQPYEADAILRISGLIGELNNTKETSVALNVPRLEYYCYVLDLYSRGLIDREAIEQWFADVDLRAQSMEGMITKRLPRNVRTDTVNPLDAAEEVIRDGIAQGNRYLFPSVYDRLSQSDKIWRQAIKRAKPSGFMDLSRLSYPVAHLLKAQDRDSMVVVVENPEEITIMHETVKLLPGIVKGAAIVGLFPHPNVLLKEPTDSIIGKQYLYFYNGERRAALREVVAANSIIYEASNHK